METMTDMKKNVTVLICSTIAVVTGIILMILLRDDESGDPTK